MSSLWAGAANRRSIRSKSPKRSAIARRKMRSFTCDVGLPTVWAARYLAMNGKRRLIGSFWHGSMANATSQAIGAQAEFPRRQVISLSGDVPPICAPTRPTLKTSPASASTCRQPSSKASPTICPMPRITFDKFHVIAHARQAVEQDAARGAKDRSGAERFALGVAQGPKSASPTKMIRPEGRSVRSPR